MGVTEIHEMVSTCFGVVLIGLVIMVVAFIVDLPAFWEYMKDDTNERKAESFRKASTIIAWIGGIIALFGVIGGIWFVLCT